MLDFIIFILVLSALVVVHEYGHFLVARKNGVGVEKFSIGFGPILLKVKGKFTEFLICAFPLGGYVKLKGESRQEHSGASDEFFSKAPGIRARIVLAGPIFNFIFAFVLFWIMSVIGFAEPNYSSTVVGDIIDDYPAAVAGVQKGDKIIEVNGVAAKDWHSMQILILKGGANVALKIERNARIVDLNIPLKSSEVLDDYGRKKTKSIIGIAPGVRDVRFNIFTGFVKSLDLLFSTTGFMLKGFGLMIVGALPFKEALSGPIGIYHITAQAREAGFSAILHFMAILNISLMIINLMPLPLMDGGHAFLFFLEKVRRKQLSEKIEDIISRIGFGLIITLMVFVFYNDLMKFGPKIWHGKKTVVEKKI
jgi:regulator of sigma E protease